MMIEDQFSVSGVGVIVTGRLRVGEPWPRILEPVTGKMPNGTMLSLTITGIERQGADIDRRPKAVGLVLRGIDMSFSLVGTEIVLDRRHRDRRQKERRRG